MNKDELIQMLQAKINNLHTLKASLERLNELQRAAETQIEIDETQATLNDLLASEA